MQYGYGRVSTIAQDTALQEDAFRRAGVRHVITEKWSSVGTRPALAELLAKLKPGDTVVVYKLDRLGRSLQDLLAILDKIGAAGATFKSLTEPIDTTTPAGKLMYSILGAVAEFEKSLIRQRSIAGQVAAVHRGARIGRPRSLSPDQEREVFKMWRSNRWSKAALSRQYNVHTDAITRAIAQFEQPSHRLCQKKRPVLGPLLGSVK